MSLTAIMSSALSGLNVAQTGMRVTSNNITNVNTPGYARQQLVQSANVAAGVLTGVEVAQVKRISDDYLVDASRRAGGRSAAAEALFEYLDRAQAVLGDPTSGLSPFDNVASVFSEFAGIAADPASAPRRSGLINDLNTTFSEFARAADEIENLRAQADQRIADVVGRVNNLLEQVVSLNGEIVRGLNSGDASGPQNVMALVVDELSSLLDVRAIPQPSGAVEIRTRDGTLLANAVAATVSYTPSGAMGPGRIFDSITAALPGAAAIDLGEQILSQTDGAGELRALLDVRDKELPAIADELSQLAATLADRLNAEHNQNVAHPAPTSLTGRNTGLVGTDSLGFTGDATLALLDTDGVLQHTVEIDFDNSRYRVDGGAYVGFGGSTVADLESSLNAALSGFGGSADFSGGALSLDGGAFGLAVLQGSQDAASAPSDRAGRGFGHVFGLNDLVTASRPTHFETGFVAADAHGLTAGGTVEIALRDAQGRVVATASHTAAAGGSFSAVFTGLNAQLAPYAALGFDAQGSVQLTPSTGFSVEIVNDQSVRGDTGLSFSQITGLGGAARAGRAALLGVASNVEADPARLALGRIDLASAAIGSVVTGAGDGAGAQALQAAGSKSGTIPASGGLATTTTSVLDFVGRVAGDIGRRAVIAEETAASASLVATEAGDRRASVEGVNMEEELVNLTVYQQGFNAASRLIQAVKEMGDTLLSIV